MKDTSQSVSVVVPVYNEEANVRLLAGELAEVSAQIPTFEALFVDDGSTDGTWVEIEACMKDHPFLRGIRCPHNRGQSAAVLRGVRETTGAIVVTMDGDLQNNPRDIPEMLRHIEGVDAVCGYRARRRDSWSRRIAGRLANRIRNWATRDGVRDTGCSLKAFRRACIADLPPFDGVHRFMPAYFRMRGRTIAQVPVDHRARTHGQSKYTNLKRLPKTVFDLIGFIWYRRRLIREETPESSPPPS